MTDSQSAQQLPVLPDDFASALVIVAHPDDPEYGIGAAVSAWTRAGKRVGYVLASRGEAGIEGMDPGRSAVVRTAEQEAACAEVGVASLEFLDQPDGRILQTPELRTAIARRIRAFRPDIVVLLNFQQTWGGRHFNSADHRNLGQAAIDAIGDAGNEWIVPGDRYDGVRRVLEFGVDPTHRVDVTDDLERAIASLACHREYLAALSDTPVEEQAETIIRSSLLWDGDRAHLGFRVYG
jgi:LmbE family N-acetylglucosaminyl deacetylase